MVHLADAADALSISRADVELAAGSRFEQTVLASGAKLQRHETRVAHPGARRSVCASTASMCWAASATRT